MKPNQLLSVAEAAAVIGIDGSQVRRYCRSGKLPASQISGTWVIRRADAEAFKPEPRGRRWPKNRPKKHGKKNPK